MHLKVSSMGLTCYPLLVPTGITTARQMERYMALRLQATTMAYPQLLMAVGWTLMQL